jgi:putative spermidine/putrescine transport system permease protein
MTAATRVVRRRGASRLNSSGIGQVGQATLAATSVVILLILLAPMIVLIIMSFSSNDYVVFPPTTFGLKWYYRFFTTDDFVLAFLTSIEVAAAASVGATLLGIPAAYVLVRRRFVGRGVLQGVFLSPLIIPQIVVGIGLLQLFAWWGVDNTVPGLVVAHVVAVLPYVMRTVGSALSTIDPHVEEAGADLGANQLQVLTLIVAPMIKGAVLAGALFALIMSWINVDISIFLSATGTYTLPVLLYNYMEYSLTPIVIVASSVSIFVAVLLVAIIDRGIGLHNAMRL